MATLSGRKSRVVLDSIEVVSDDQKWVLIIARDSEGSASITLRKSTDTEYWNNDRSIFSLNQGDNERVRQALSGQDVYDYKTLSAITSTRFTIQLPEPDVTDPVSME